MYLLHPAAIHFTVAFLLAGVACGLWSTFRDAPGAARFGTIASALGAASLVPSIVTGYLAANTAPMPPGAHAALDRHEQAGLVLFGLVLVGLVWTAWHRGALPASQRAPFAALQLAVAAVVIWVALLGGTLVYHEGVGVSPRPAPSSPAPAR